MAKFSYTRGTTYNTTFNYTPPEGAPDGATALFTVKTEIDNDITDTENDIVKKDVPMTDNSCVIKLEPDDIGMEHEAGAGYTWDIKVLDADGDIWPAVSGEFELDVTATNRITA